MPGTAFAFDPAAEPALPPPVRSMEGTRVWDAYTGEVVGVLRAPNESPVGYEVESVPLVWQGDYS